MDRKDAPSTPVPVEVTGTPTVRIEGPEPTPTVTGISGSQSARPTTTEEEDRRTLAQRQEQDRRTLGQRQTSMLWESTQMKIALSAIWVTLLVSTFLIARGAESERVAAFLFLSNLTATVVGFYFGRTNHQRVGGVGGDSAGTR